MILLLTSALVLAAAPSQPSTASGLISTSQMVVRAVVEDRCTVSPAGVTCQGPAPIRPLAAGPARSATRIDIVF